MQEWLLGKMGAILHQEAKVSEVSDKAHLHEQF